MGERDVARVRNTTRGTVLAERAELALGPVARLVGLLGRAGLAQGGGMVLEPCDSVHTAFMRFPIDVVVLSPEGDVLRAQSDLIRTQRFQAAERAGAYAATKILFPLILFIMPAVFIVIFGPIVLNFVFGTGVLGGGPQPPPGGIGG